MSTPPLKSFLRFYQDHFEVTDVRAAVIVAGVAAAHYLDGEMVWMRVVGASRSGKSELITAFSGHEDATEMEVLTPASLRGGMHGGHDVLTVLDGKLVITKDLAALLSTRSDVRNEILGLFRNIKDGRLVSDFNTTKGGRREQSARFDWLSATTPAVYDYRGLENLLGARFVDVLMPEPNRLAMAVRAAENNPKLAAIRADLRNSANDIMNLAKEEAAKGPTDLTSSESALLADWADLTALARSPVARDHGHNLQSPPSAEVGTDLAQTFTRIAKGLKTLGVSDFNPYVAMLAWNSIPTFRVELIMQMLEARSVPEISISAGAKSYEKDNLLLLGLTVRDPKEGYRLVPELEARFKAMAAVSRKHTYT